MDKNTIIKEIELLVKTDQNLKAYDLVKDYEGDDLEISFWKDKLYGYIEHAFNKEKYDNFYSTLPEFDHLFVRCTTASSEPPNPFVLNRRGFQTCSVYPQ